MKNDKLNFGEPQNPNFALQKPEQGKLFAVCCIGSYHTFKPLYIRADAVFTVCYDFDQSLHRDSFVLARLIVTCRYGSVSAGQNCEV